ncbi:MAG: hypothetical protein P4M07_22190 [Xanthobacteraceae bacterium]|nr:hypothetical protein [Xanthobacteraceae bacterium]
MKRAAIGLMLAAVGEQPTLADTTVPGTPFAVSAAVPDGSTPLVLNIPANQGTYIYVTDFSVTGTGVTTPAMVLITYQGMSDGVGSKVQSFDVLVPPAQSLGQQINFHRSYSYPWQSMAPGVASTGAGQVQIIVSPLGAGNYGAVARVVGFYQ